MYVAQYWRKDQMGIFDVHHQRHIPHLINVCIVKGNDFFFQMYAYTYIDIYTTCTRVNTQPLYCLSLHITLFLSYINIYMGLITTYCLRLMEGCQPFLS